MGTQQVSHNARTLVLSIATLDLLVYTLLHFPFEDPRPCWLIETCNLQDVGSVDPVVGSPAHDMVASNLEFVDGDLIWLAFCENEVS